METGWSCAHTDIYTPGIRRLLEFSVFDARVCGRLVPSSCDTLIVVEVALVVVVVVVVVVVLSLLIIIIIIIVLRR